MSDKVAGVYVMVWVGLACAGLWLLFDIQQRVKAMHFMMEKWFERDYVEPFEKGMYDDD